MVWSLVKGPDIVPPEQVADEESVARSVHQSNGFQGNKNSDEDKVRFAAFTPPKNQTNPTESIREISVDRCDYIDEDGAIDQGWRRAPARGGKFYGWAIISAKDARECGPEVMASPQEENLVHADILLPIKDTTNTQDRNARLVELAKLSNWKYLPAPLI